MVVGSMGTNYCSATYGGRNTVRVKGAFPVAA